MNNVIAMVTMPAWVYVFLLIFMVMFCLGLVVRGLLGVGKKSACIMYGLAILVGTLINVYMNWSKLSNNQPIPMFGW